MKYLNGHFISFLSYSLIPPLSLFLMLWLLIAYSSLWFCPFFPHLLSFVITKWPKFVICMLQDFSPTMMQWLRLTGFQLKTEISATVAVQLYSCAMRLSCQASYLQFSSATHLLLYSTDFETTRPRLSCGEPTQLGRCSAIGSHFSSGGESTCCAFWVSSAAGNLVTEHAWIQELCSTKTSKL